MHIILFLFSFVVFNTIKAQDYTTYYNIISRAKSAKSFENLKLADSLYNHAFSNNWGFGDDYQDALLNRYRLIQKIDEELFVLSSKAGTPWIDMKGDLKQLGINYLAPYKKLHRKNKHKRSVNGFPIMKLMIRDQCARSNFFRFFIRKDADSVNAVKLQKLLIKKPELFDRTKTSWLCTQMLNVLLMHQGEWKNTKNLFFPIRELVKQGKIEPFSIQSMVERASLFEGTLFEIDTLTGELKAIEKGHKAFCEPYSFYYSTTYGMEGRLYDRENGKVFLPPHSPMLTKSELNKLRNYLFLLDVEEKFLSEKFIFLTAEEFCEKMRLKYKF